VSSLATLLAHQGGWDEILMIVGPVVVVIGLLRWARNRQQTEATNADGSRSRPE
jgi:hypothetical protein